MAVVVMVVVMIVIVVVIFIMVVMMILMVAWTAVQIILGRSIQAQNNTRVHHAFGHFDNRKRARCVGFDQGLGLCHALWACQIRLGQQDNIGAGNLITKDFGQRGFVVQPLIRFALGVHSGHVAGKTTVCDRLGVCKGDHAIYGDFAADIRPVKSLQKRFRKRQTRGLDQDVVRARLQSHQGFDCGDKVIGHGAADTAVCQLHNVFRRAIGDRAGFQDIAIHANIAKFIDHNGKSLALWVLHQVAHQGRFAGTEKSGDDSNGEFFKGRHGSYSGKRSGGMRAIQFLRK